MALPTQREIAHQLGLSQSTVSRALGGDGVLPAATVAAVRELAQRLGYRPDAQVSGLAHRRWNGADAPVLAYLGSVVCGDGERHDKYWLALRKAARARGVVLRHVDHASATSVDLGERLWSDGVRALVVGQRNHPNDHWSLDWGRFAVVHCGAYLVPGPGDVVMADLLSAPAQAVAQLRVDGCQRPAACLVVHPGSLSETMLAGALEALHLGEGLPVWIGAPADWPAVAGWLAEVGPEAVLAYGDGSAEALARLGVRLPVHVLAGSEERHAPGLCVPRAAIAQRAVDLVLERLRSGQCGLDGERRIHLVPMTWVAMGAGAS